MESHGLPFSSAKWDYNCRAGFSFTLFSRFSLNWMDCHWDLLVGMAVHWWLWKQLVQDCVPDHVYKDHIYQSVYCKATCRCSAVISWECYTEKKIPPCTSKMKTERISPGKWQLRSDIHVMGATESFMVCNCDTAFQHKLLPALLPTNKLFFLSFHSHPS